MRTSDDSMENQVVEYAHVRMDLMTSKQVQGYLRHNDMVILPVGCFEMHGPHIPLSCDIYTEWAVDILLADRWACLVMPPVAYSFAGATAGWPGTIDISPEATYDYVKAVVKAVLKAGFNRVVLSASHWPSHALFSTLSSAIYQETGAVVLNLRPIPVVMPDEAMIEALGYPWGEDILMLAALKILGWHGAYDPCCMISKSMEYPPNGFTEFNKLGSLASVPSIFLEDYRHTGIRAGIQLEEAEQAIEVIKKAIVQFDHLPELFTRYQAELDQIGNKSFLTDPDIWSI